MTQDDHYLSIAHVTNVIDGRSNSGTARVAREIILELANFSEIGQTFIHFEHSDDPIYSLPNVKEVIIPLYNFWIGSHFFSFIIFWVRNYFNRKGLRFDVVHWHASRVYPFFFLIPSHKVVITLHDATNRIFKDVNTFWTRVFYWNLIIFKSKYDYIIGDSFDASRKLVEIARFPLEKVRTVYLASNFDKLSAVKPERFIEDMPYILCVSRWQPYKNVAILVEAFNDIRDQLSNCPKLVLVGKPVAGYDKPVRLVESLFLQDDVLFFFDLSDGELAYLYDNALIHVSPSLHEGFGLPVLEALKRGCPSLDHSYTSSSEISGAAGIHVNMNSRLEISKSLVWICENRSALNEFRTSARLRAKDFSWKESAKQLIALYRL